MSQIFNLAQTFYVDKSLAPQNDTIAITSVDIYFMYKPAANNNQSGINLPGITVYLTPTIFNVPQITNDSLNNFARVEYNGIQTSSDATVTTRFRFNQPVLVTPGTQYAIVLSFDGNEPFTPWTAVKGQWIVDTRNVLSANPSSLIGNYYEYVSLQNDTTSNPLNASSQSQYTSFWTPVNNTQLTFNVYAARYAVNGVPVKFAGIAPTIPIFGGSQTETWDSVNKILGLVYPSRATEAITFDFSQSTVQSFIGAQRCYQNTFSYPGGSIGGGTYVTVATQVGNTIVTANATYPNGAAFNWNIIFPSLAGIKYIVLKDVSGVNVRRVVGIANTLSVIVDEPVTFTNSIAQFLLTPAATVDSVINTSPYGKQKHVLFLTQSSANATVRFVNNTILSMNASPGGTGYNNSDIVYIKGYEFVAGKAIGGYVAVANITTNTVGGITGVFPSNAGAGFVNTSNMVAVVANSAQVGNTISNTSAGSGATFNYTVGATLQTEQTTNIFQNCVVSNFNIDDVTAFFQIYNPTGTNYSINVASQYFMNVDPAVFSGFVYYVTPNPQQYSINLNHLTSLVSNSPLAYVSFSNEFVTCYANGALNDQVNSATQTSNSIVVTIDQTVNTTNDFLSIAVQTTPTIEFGRYIINNSHFDEWTNQGNAWAKHLTTLFNFNNYVEDLRVYLTVYKPINTEFRVYAKIQNANDPQSFSSEDWTKLQLIAGAGLVSSTSNPSDYVELGYGFFPYPQLSANDASNTTITVAGSITTSNNSATITGVNTAFLSSANISNGTLIRLYAPLFGNADYIVATVNNAVSDTSLVLDTIVTSNVNIGGNPALIATGLALDVIKPSSHQAWNNINNDNVSRYYSGSTVKYDAFSTMQLKVVMLSNTYSYIPQINSIRLLGVSA